MIQICFNKWYLPKIQFPDRQEDKDIEKEKKKKNFIPSFLCERKWDFFFTQREHDGLF